MATSTETAYLYGGVFFLVAFVALLLMRKFNTGSGEIGLILFGATVVLIGLYEILK
jgi:hypothetical protein